MNGIIKILPRCKKLKLKNIFNSVLKHPELYPSCNSVLSNYCEKENCYRLIRKDNLIKYISPELLNKKFVSEVYVVGTTDNVYSVPNKFL